MSDAASDARREERMHEQWERDEARANEARRQFVDSLVTRATSRKWGTHQRATDCSKILVVRNDKRWGKYARSIESTLEKLRKHDSKEFALLLIDLLETAGLYSQWYESVKAVAPAEVVKVIESVDQAMLWENIQSETIHRLRKLL